MNQHSATGARVRVFKGQRPTMWEMLCKPDMWEEVELRREGLLE